MRGDGVMRNLSLDGVSIGLRMGSGWLDSLKPPYVKEWYLMTLKLDEN